MENTYIIPMDHKALVEKEIAKYQKKAQKYGNELSFEWGEPYAEKIAIREHDYHEISTVDTIMVEVLPLTIKGEIIKKGSYTVEAMLEHLEGGNVTTCFGSENKPEWAHMDGYCEHCHSNRQRRVTFIVNGEDGREIQVGRSCLADYCGINPQAIGWSNEIHDIILNSDLDHFCGWPSRAGIAYDTMEALAHAISVDRMQGYIPSRTIGANKGKVEDLMKEGKKPAEADMKAAEEMASLILSVNEDDARKFWLDNIQTLLRSKYCKYWHSGTVAFVPEAVRRYHEEIAKRSQREHEKEAEKGSEYVGEVGQRMVFNITSLRCVTSWETQFGTTYLYKFLDENENVLIWFASKPMLRRDGSLHTSESCNQIKATVKDHNERDGVKQTIITRCVAC